MKKLIFILLTSITCISYSQSYHPLLKQGKLWYVVGWSACFDILCGDFGSYTDIYKVGYDTLIHGKKYYRMLSTRDSSLNNFKKRGLYREDTVQKKVYSYNNDTSDVLLYDFSLGKHDTLLRQCNGDKMLVDSVDSVEIGGVYRKRLHFFSEGGPPEEWIEGIGSTFGITRPGMNDKCIIDAGYELSCMYEDDSLVYGGNCYQSTSGIKDWMQGRGVQLMPNPVSGHSILHVPGTPGKNYSITIMSSAGIPRETCTFTGTGTIDIYKQRYTPGVYIYMVCDDERVIHAGKFIVH
jgi:hypothetical protein